MSAEIISKLDKLALSTTMIDDSLTDLQSVVELSQLVDELKTDLAVQEPPELGALFAALSTAVEGYILGDGDPKKGPVVIELTNEAINLVRNMLSGDMEPDVFQEKAEAQFGILKETFGVTATVPPSAGGSTAASEGKEEESALGAEEPAEQPDRAEEEEEKAGPARTEIKLIDENDTVIFEGFLEESTDQVNKIEEYVMTLEEEPENMDIINSLFRVFHSLKGAAGFLGMTEINYLCHEAENLLDKARKSQIRIESEFIDVVLAARDLLEKGLSSISETITEGKTKLPNFRGMVEQLNVRPVIDMINRKLYGYEVLPDDEPKLGQILLKNKTVTADKLKEALHEKDKPLGELLVDMGAASKEDIDNALKKQTDVKDEKGEKKTYHSTAIKVDTQKLNVLLELVGELVISQAIISQNKVLQEDNNERLSKDINEMSKITAGIQDHIMALRMVPLRQTFQKMNRLVRDLARKTDKKVNFVIQGEETEIDKTLVEKLNDPLIHMLRNAVDHGMESAEERAEKGKPAEGTVKLHAYQKGGNVVIEVSDDGKGLKVEKIRKKAMERGLMEKDRTYTDEEMFQFIFMPGFSTHDVATDLSGRGVGMDVVRRYIGELGGRVDISSVPDKGSTFYIRLPLTMAIVDGMLVKVGSENYIIPTVTISESLRPHKEQLNTVVNVGEVVSVRGELIPLIRLNKLLNIPNGRTSIVESLVIIVGNEKERRGLLVDDLLGQQQVVIKNLDRRLHGIRGFSGSSILGDGLVGLIVDVGGIFEMAKE